MKLKTIALLVALLILPVAVHADESKGQPVKFEEIKLDSYCFPFDPVQARLDIIHETRPEVRSAREVSYIAAELVINDDKKYQSLLRVRRAPSGPCKDDGSFYDDKSCKQQNQLAKKCVAMNPPKINFSEKTVLGKWVTGSCVTVGFKTEVFRDDSNKTITYSVERVDRMEPNAVYDKCVGFNQMILAVIPKVPADYKVLFIPSFDEEKHKIQFYKSRDGKTFVEDWDGNEKEVIKS